MSRRQMQVIGWEIESNEIEITEREKAIDHIHSEMTDINEIMKDLAILVESQSPIVNNLEQAIESSRRNVERGVKELEKAQDIQQKQPLGCFIM